MYKPFSNGSKKHKNKLILKEATFKDKIKRQKIDVFFDDLLADILTTWKRIFRPSSKVCYANSRRQFSFLCLDAWHSPKSSANPIMVAPIWKREFVNGEHPIRGLYRIFLKNLFSNFCLHIKDSKWGKKSIFMNCASRNGSPKQILIQQLPFANEAKSQYHCKAFWATCTSRIKRF